MVSTPTPAQTAKNEAAKQAVGLVFAVAGVVLLILVQKKMGGGMMAAVQAEADMIDPTAARVRRMERARSDAKRFDRLASWSFRYGPDRLFAWAWRGGEKARAAYEAERP